MAPRFTRVTLEIAGPLFTRDPRKTVKGNIRRMMAGLAAEGERAVRSEIGSLNLPRSTGWTQGHAVGRVESLSGKDWAATAVISAYTGGMGRSDAIRTKAAASSVEGRYHPFRRVTTALRRSRAVFAANLVDGLE